MHNDEEQQNYKDEGDSFENEDVIIIDANHANNEEGEKHQSEESGEGQNFENEEEEYYEEGEEQNFEGEEDVFEEEIEEGMDNSEK